jgi:hypothetical protein
MQSPDAIARAYMNGAGCSQLGCSGLAEALETMANGLPLNNKAVVDVCSSPDVISTFRAFLGIIGEEADAVVQVSGGHPGGSVCQVRYRSQMRMWARGECKVPPR